LEEVSVAFRKPHILFGISPPLSPPLLYHYKLEESYAGRYTRGGGEELQLEKTKYFWVELMKQIF
jgi:hypothetical protein